MCGEDGKDKKDRRSEFIERSRHGSSASTVPASRHGRYRAASRLSPRRGAELSDAAGAIVSGYPPGGVNDIYARLIGQWLSERLGQQFIVENRAGAGGTLAADAVVRSPPDGYTLLLATSADAWNASLYDNLKYDFCSRQRGGRRDCAGPRRSRRAPVGRSADRFPN